MNKYRILPNNRQLWRSCSKRADPAPVRQTPGWRFYRLQAATHIFCDILSYALLFFLALNQTSFLLPSVYICDMVKRFHVKCIFQKVYNLISQVMKKHTSIFTPFIPEEKNQPKSF